MAILPFLPLARQFRAVFLDSYGVLKNASGIIEGGIEAVAALREANVAIRVLTNDASRSKGRQGRRFREMGYDIRPDEIITSGMMTRLFLQDKIVSGKVAYLGTEAAAGYIEDAGCEPVPVSAVTEASDIQAVAFLDDEGFDWQSDLNAMVNLLRERNVPVLVANSDQLYPVRGGRVAIATGAIAKAVEQVVGRKFLRFGKPDSQMFSFAFEDLNLHDSVRKRDILMVGDTLATDILGGNKFGIRTCLTLSGNVREENYEDEVVRRGVVPDYVVRSIGEATT